MKKVSLNVQLVDTITSIIESGTWKPGDKLPNEIELASSFDVSRNIMREAMKILVNFGILDSKAGIGTFVSDNAIGSIHNMRFFNGLKGNNSVEKILETRLIIEPELAYYACLRCTDADIEELTDNLNEADKRHIKEDFFHTDDFDFHVRVAELSGNEILANLLSTLLDQLKHENYIQFNQYVSREVKENSINDHQRILKAIQNHDPLLARKIMHDHLFARIKVINSSYDTDLALSKKIAERRNGQID
jgi:DNA-binding FadR family transcriptional regulator